MDEYFLDTPLSDDLINIVYVYLNDYTYKYYKYCCEKRNPTNCNNMIYKNGLCKKHFGIKCKYDNCDTDTQYRKIRKCLACYFTILQTMK